ncbi:hypothetical protein BDR22DRAFT_964690 [Usnea florida]
MAPFSSILSISLLLYLHVSAEMNSSCQSANPRSPFDRVKFWCSFGQPPATTSIANASGSLFSNTSLSNFSDWPYIIPWNETQDCDIYGLLCQTGSITVGLHLATATTITVLPCSSYLSAQSAYLQHRNDIDEDEPDAPWDSNDLDPDTNEGKWAVNFGQSPECNSYAAGQYTVSECGSRGLDLDYASQIPPSLYRTFHADYLGTCCGNCSLDVSGVRLYYFPDTNAVCNNRTTNTTSALSARNIEKRIHSLVADGSTAIVSGHTFTSPSIYLQLIGAATVSDQCTTVGPVLTDPIITLAPDRVSTWMPPINEMWLDYDNFTVGEIWNDPTDNTELDFAEDPPVALTPVARLLPSPRPTLAPASAPAGSTTVPEGARTSTEAAKPVSSPNDPAAPAKTGDPARDGPTQSHAIVSANPTSLLDGSATSSNDEGDPPSDPKVPSVHAIPGDSPADPNAPSSEIPDPPSDPKGPLVHAVPGDPPADPNTPSSGTPDPQLDGSQKSIIDPKASSVPGPPQGERLPSQTQGLGAIIYNAFGKSGPEIDASSTISFPPQSVFTIGSQTFTANPSAFSIAGTTVSVNGPPVTISGTIISLGQNGALQIDSSTISLPTPSDPSPNKVYTVAGQTFTPDPSAFPIDGTTVSAGGPAATVHGTIISLGQNGALQIGSSIISLPTDPPSKVYTVAGQKFVPNPSAFPIDGTIVSAGGLAATIDRTIISLGQNGALRIGSSTISLPTDPPSKIYTIAGQTFTPNPSAFPIDGTIVSAGGPAATVHGTIISLGPDGALQIGSSTIPLLPSPASSNTTIDGFDIDPQSSFIVVDGVTLGAASPGVTISGERVSLEVGGKTVDIGTGRFAVPTPTTTGDGVGVQAFTGGQGRGVEVSSFLICGIVVGVVMMVGL